MDNSPKSQAAEVTDLSQEELHPQTAKRPLVPADRAKILDSLLDGITKGESEAELSSRRQKLAELLGCSTSQVNAVGAWIKIHAQRALKEAGVTQPVDPYEFVIACECARLDLLKFGGAIVDVCYANELNIAPPQFDAAASIYHGVRKAWSAQLVQPACPPLPVAQEPTEAPPSDTKAIRIVVSSGADAAHANYDNPEKIAWRNSWFDFLKRSLNPKFLANAHVLCLPSAKCEREVSGYLSLGIKPENILACEKDESVQAEFVSRAQALGIKYHLGSVEGFLTRTKEYFEIVSLDYPGPLCDPYLKALSNLRLNTFAAVMVNVMGAREQTTTKRVLNFMHQASGAIKSGSLVDGFQEIMSKAIAERMPLPKVKKLFGEYYQEKVIGPMLSNESTIGETRKSSLSGTVLNSISTRVKDNVLVHLLFDKSWSKYLDAHKFSVRNPVDQTEMKWSDIPMGRKVLIGSIAAQQLGMYLALELSRFSLPSSWGGLTSKDFGSFAVCLALGLQLPVMLEEYTYNSGVSSARTPFSSTFAIMHNPKLDYCSPKWSEANVFVLKAIRHLMAYRENRLAIHVRYGHNHLRRGEGLRGGHRLQLYDTTNFQLVDEIRARDLFNPLLEALVPIKYARQCGMSNLI